MKLIMILFFIIPFSSFAKEVSIDVPGMVCQMCVHGIKKSFKSVVKNKDEDIKVDLENKTVWLNLKKDISDKEIRKRVKKAGYNAAKINRLKTDTPVRKKL